MMKSTALLFMLFVSHMLVGQGFYLIKRDSANWHIEQRIPSQGGGGTINFSAAMDSLTAVERFTSLVESRKRAIDDKILEKEYQQLNNELKRITGLSFEDRLKDRLAADMVGNWNLVYSDTISININKSLRVTGGRVRGEVTIIDGDQIGLKNVLPGMVTLTKQGKSLVGTLNNKPVMMIKQQEQ